MSPDRQLRLLADGAAGEINERTDAAGFFSATQSGSTIQCLGGGRVARRVRRRTGKIVLYSLGVNGYAFSRESGRHDAVTVLTVLL